MIEGQTLPEAPGDRNLAYALCAGADMAGGNDMKISHWLRALLLITSLGTLAACGETARDESDAPPAEDGPSVTEAAEGFTGSVACRPCHERFYELWAPSHHGTAMQPYTSELAAARLTEHDHSIEVEGVAYRADLDTGHVIATASEGEPVRYPLVHAMGGKNVFYFLTPLEKGRLQVLPIAYDVGDAGWYDTTESMVRHAAAHPDEAVDWKDPLLTFNTACWGCHVSQLSVGYDRETDTYDSTWSEPGINCETCHGPGHKHVKVCEEAPEGTVPEDLEIILVSEFSHEQNNANCASCHAKAMVIAAYDEPGGRFFDHFDLVCLENADFYPDGRDLGENYTFTTWRQSPCAKSGKLDCVHCHTSSGRTRFLGEQSNEACLPCHAEHVENAPAHTHHAEDSLGSRCVSCHMPMTEFAHMRRSDHSMRPPAPSLSKRFQSPNACTICHEDQDDEWADGHVREWRVRDYQAPMLHAGELVDAARKGDWTRLDEMLEAVASEDRNEVVATSLIRLLASCPEPRKALAFGRALSDPSPLVRASAAAGLEGLLAPANVRALFDATGDDTRLVRVRAAWTLAGIPAGGLPPEQAAQLAKANEELEASFELRPDEWSGWYNLGNLYDRRGDGDAALAAYERASKLRPDVVAPYVNASMIHARRGHEGLAEKVLLKGLEADAENAAVHYNLGLLLANGSRLEESRKHLERALELDPRMAGAAYNLGLMKVEGDLAGGLDLLKRANLLRGDEPRYAWAYAFHLNRGGRAPQAIAVLSDALKRGAVSADMIRLLAVLYGERGEHDQARTLLSRAAQDPRLPEADREAFRRAVQGPGPR